MLGEKVASVNDIPSPPHASPFLFSGFFFSLRQPPSYPSGQETVFVVVVFVIVTAVIVVILAQFQSDLNTWYTLCSPAITMASRRLCQGSLFPFITTSLCVSLTDPFHPEISFRVYFTTAESVYK